MASYKVLTGALWEGYACNPLRSLIAWHPLDLSLFSGSSICSVSEEGYGRVP